MVVSSIRAKLAVRSRLKRAQSRWRAESLYEKYQPYTMIIRPHFVTNVELAAKFLADPKLSRGAVIECGCWRGGMSAALIELGGPERDYFFFDSFEGLPPAQEIDGKAALAWQANTTSPHYRDNCAASLEEFLKTVSLSGIDPRRVHAVKGFFDHTFPSFGSVPISVLRLDADWYDSTMICLNKFWDDVLPGGLILIDDYYMWDGCSRAVHDFLSARKATERIQEDSGVGYMVKRAASNQ